MTNKYQPTREEEAYRRLLNEEVEMLSEAAQSVLDGATFEAYKLNLCRTYAYEPFEYEEAMEKMRIAAAKLTNRDCKLLGELWRAALAAAASIDYDDETPAWNKVCRGDLHRYYRMASGMVEHILQE